MQNLADSLTSVGKNFAIINKLDEKIHLGQLKDLKDVKLRPYLSNEYNSEMRAFAFFLINFLDDIFFNLIGDFPYEEPYGESVHLIRKEFFNNLWEKLNKMGDALHKNDFVQINECMILAIIDYIDTINKINEKIEIGI